MQDIANKIAADRAKVAQNIASSVELEKSNYADNDLNKMNSWDALDEDGIEKGHKDVSHLQMKMITDKNGHQRKVYVRTHDDGKEHHFENGHDVEFEHKGQKVKGTIKSMKHHPKFDKFGTAEIADEHGNKYYKSLRNVDHSSKETPEEQEKREVAESRKKQFEGSGDKTLEKHFTKETANSGKEVIYHKQDKNGFHKYSVGDEEAGVSDKEHEELQKHPKFVDKSKKKSPTAKDGKSDQKTDMHMDKRQKMKEMLDAEKPKDKSKIKEKNPKEIEDEFNDNLISNLQKDAEETKTKKNDDNDDEAQQKSFKKELNKLNKNSTLEELKKSIDYTELSLVELNELIKSNEVQVFTPQNLTKYSEDLRKSFDNDEITRDEWQQGVQETHQLTKSIVTNEQGDKYLVYLKINDINVGKEDLQKSEENDELEKGMITDTFNNNPEFNFEKTGKELKTILPTTIANLNAELFKLEQEMSEIQEQISIEPTGNCCPVYNNSNICCKDYSYEQRQEANNNTTQVTEATIELKSGSASNELGSLMYKYNEKTYKWGSITQDILTCTALIDNVEDDKQYKFTVSQLVALNSGDENMMKAVENTIDK